MCPHAELPWQLLLSPASWRPSSSSTCLMALLDPYLPCGQLLLALLVWTPGWDEKSSLPIFSAQSLAVQPFINKPEMIREHASHHIDTGDSSI